MRNFALIALAGLGLASCTEQPQTNWTNDCERYHSVNDREYSECMKRVEEGRTFDDEDGTVKIDPNSSSTDRQTFDEVGKVDFGD